MIDITIICQNKIGMLSYVTDAFEKNGINLLDVVAHTFGERSTITIVVDDENLSEARAIVLRLGLIPLIEECFIIRLPDRPGALSEAVRLLDQAKLNILVTRIFDRKDDHVFVALTTDNPEKASEVLRQFDARKSR